MNGKTLILLLAIFFLGLGIRLYYIYPTNIVLGYDQIAQLISAKKIVDFHDIIIMGAATSGLEGLRHGALFDYFTAIPYFLGGGNPMFIAYWYSFFNTLTVFVVFAFTYFLFRNSSAALISAFMAAVSYQMVQIAGWISNTTVTLFLLPVFFLSLWFYYKKEEWTLILSFALLGLMIQSQTLMAYYLAVIPLLWLIFRLRIPSLKIALMSVFSFTAAISTIIITEIKLNFSGVKIFLNFSKYLDESSVPLIKRFLLFGNQFLRVFSSNISPQYPKIGMIVGLITPLIIVYLIFIKKTKKEERTSLIFLLTFLVSPILMLVVGYHDKPWTLMGLIPAVIISVGYIISKVIFFPFGLIILSLITYLNLSSVLDGHQKEVLFIKQEPSSTLKGQLAVIDYTYREAKREPFAINSVTYPLYYNTYWSYHYPWYGLEKYGYLPGWLGGDQIYPYNALPKASEKDKIFYMIVDETATIPDVHRSVGRKWGLKYGKLLEEKSIGGFTVQKFQTFN